MTEIVINRCRKGTMFSEAGLAEYADRKGVARESVSAESIPRDDPVLAQMMRDDLKLYSGHCAHIQIVTVADDFKWKIMRRGNFEWVAADA